MADVGDKAARQLLELIEVARHIVERDRQLVDLVAVVVLGHAHIEVAGGKFLGRGRDRLERARDMLRDDERDDEHDGQRHQQDEHERLRGVAHHACRIVGSCVETKIERSHASPLSSSTQVPDRVARCDSVSTPSEPTDA